MSKLPFYTKYKIKSIKKCGNGVAMARHGPILGQNEATATRSIFKCLPALRNTIFISQIAANVKKSPNPVFLYVWVVMEHMV